jgi:hypothetical protein
LLVAKCLPCTVPYTYRHIKEACAFLPFSCGQGVVRIPRCFSHFAVLTTELLWLGQGFPPGHTCTHLHIPYSHLTHTLHIFHLPSSPPWILGASQSARGNLDTWTPSEPPLTPFIASLRRSLTHSPPLPISIWIFCPTPPQGLPRDSLGTYCLLRLPHAHSGPPPALCRKVIRFMPQYLAYLIEQLALTFPQCHCGRLFSR